MAVQQRQTSVSWLELGVMVAILTGRAIGPNGASFLVAAAICKQLWSRLARFIHFTNDDGHSIPLKRNASLIPNAGASVTCGLANQSGLTRRPVSDDCPGLAFGTAALLMYAAESSSRICATVLAYTRMKTRWQPSGILSTIEQIRASPVRSRPANSQLKADFRQGKAYQSADQTPKKLKGPCLFGCQNSATTAGRSAWYKIPKPSPWPGVAAGEIVCRKCYLWGIANKRAKQKRSAILPTPCPPCILRHKIGDTVKIKGLKRAVHLNGKLGKITVPADDADRITMEVDGYPSAVRLKTDNVDPWRFDGETVQPDWVADAAAGLGR